MRAWVEIWHFLHLYFIDDLVALHVRAWVEIFGSVLKADLVVSPSM